MRAVVKRVNGQSFALIQLSGNLDLRVGDSIHIFTEEMFNDSTLVDEAQLDDVIREASIAVSSAHAAVLQSIGPPSNQAGDDVPMAS
ncbi:MAG TPA: hypothetical protein VGN46_02810 [Luteibacter sp.]|uniref:hypothetical protein n=1 Tax=Luteibacter sp. TaxID=1886636 RepID=UPI002F422E9F